MLDRLAVRVDGVGPVARALAGLAGDVVEPDAALDDIAAYGERVVAGFAPYRSGRLAGNVSGRRVGGRAVVGVTLPYGGPINYGWARRNITGSGFLQRADAPLTPYAERRLDRGVDTDIRTRGLA